MDVAARLRDFFTLRTAAEEARRRPVERREALESALQLGRQRAEAAEALWSNGHAAEGLRLIADALERTIDAATVLVAELPDVPRPSTHEPAPDTAVTEAESPAESPAADDPTIEGAETPSEAVRDERAADAASTPDVEAPEAPAHAPTSAVGAERTWKDVAARRGVSAEDVATLDRVVGLARRPLPALDAAVSAADAEIYRAIYKARAELDTRIAPASLTVGQVRLRVVQRWSFGVVTVLAAIGLLWLALRTPREVSTTANAFYRNDPQYASEKAVDDDPNTEWLLNDGQTGWLEVRLSPARELTKIRILNGHNRHFNDRAIKEFQVELYDASGQKVFEHAGELEFSPTPSWLEIPVSATGVERVRLSVISHHRVGAALAELAFEER